MELLKQMNPEQARQLIQQLQQMEQQQMGEANGQRAAGNMEQGAPQQQMAAV
jgi:hypothetical protein